MAKYQVFYKKYPTFLEDGKLTIDEMHKSHVFVKNVEASSLEDVFAVMQGENWSPNGEARDLILKKGLHHTSMSIGDVIGLNNQYWEVAFIGFTELPKYLCIHCETPVYPEALRRENICYYEDGYCLNCSQEIKLRRSNRIYL
ncbi:MAG: hypothetical protein PHO27_12950 [Sulfuricurvum sp.]|nr:hypothetical protein [Sulfuricurvum sp.]